jgi:tetratricopeptide (TPR) repeat protein
VAVERHLSHQALIETTHETVRDYNSHQTELGHFEIYYPSGVDEILIHLAEETLEAAYREIGTDFNYWPEEPVRVEIYPNTHTLSAVTGLSQEAIETSGTIAICKFNRIMITSPRSLLHGYTWRDTLAHEYVHYILQHLTGTRIPIWLHEGLAKFEESRWHLQEPQALPVTSQDLLAQRIASDSLIPFSDMHPSMALLPSQEDTQTAFAQVYSAVEYLVERYGQDSLQRLVWTIREGADVESALTQITGLGFDDFTQLFTAFISGRTWERLSGDYRHAMAFLPEEATDAPPDELAGIAEEEARNFMYLGQLLQARNRPEAAIGEFIKAQDIIGTENPLLQNRIARVLLDLNRPEEAIDTLDTSVERYPEIYQTCLHMGEAKLETGRADEAVEWLIRAAGINPFDPEVHRQLSRAYTAMGFIEEADRSAQHLNLLLSHQH